MDTIRMTADNRYSTQSWNKKIFKFLYHIFREQVMFLLGKNDYENIHTVKSDDLKHCFFSGDLL
jgi:hypothetical protein